MPDLFSKKLINLGPMKISSQVCSPARPHRWNCMETWHVEEWKGPPNTHSSSRIPPTCSKDLPCALLGLALGGVGGLKDTAASRDSLSNGGSREVTNCSGTCRTPGQRLANHRGLLPAWKQDLSFGPRSSGKSHTFPLVPYWPIIKTTCCCRLPLHCLESESWLHLAWTPNLSIGRVPWGREILFLVVLALSSPPYPTLTQSSGHSAPRLLNNRT